MNPNKHYVGLTPFKHGQNNPHLQTVSDAEKRSRKYSENKSIPRYVDRLFERNWAYKLTFPTITPEEVEDEDYKSIAAKIKATVDAEKEKMNLPDTAACDKFIAAIEDLVDCDSLESFNYGWDTACSVADQLGIWLEPFM